MSGLLSATLTPPREDEKSVTDYRLEALEFQVRTFAPTVTQVAQHEAEIDATRDGISLIREAVGKLDDAGANFRSEIRDEFKSLRKEIADDRRESRNRTLLALGPIGLAALAIFAKIVLNVDLPGAG